jgi:ribonuclease P protein component
MHGQAGGHRLRRSARLRSRKDFLRVQGGGARTASRHFLLLRAERFPGAVGEGARLGITVSRRVAGAVGRSRVKRRVREVFRRGRDRLTEADLVVIARGGAAELPADEARRELEQLFRRGAER